MSFFYVGNGRTCLLWRGVALCACRLLEHGVAVGVGESEVDELHVVAVACHNYVGKFQVAVHNLLAVHVLQRIGYLPDNVHLLGNGMPLSAPFAQSNAVNPLHHYARADALHLFERRCRYYIVVLQLHEYFELLLEEHAVCRVAPVGFQAFQHPPSAIPTSPCKQTEPRCGDNLNIGEV